jgi:hypothetical protein
MSWTKMDMDPAIKNKQDPHLWFKKILFFNQHVAEIKPYRLSTTQGENLNLLCVFLPPWVCASNVFTEIFLRI